MELIVVIVTCRWKNQKVKEETAMRKWGWEKTR